VQRIAAQTRAVSLDARRLLQELLGLYDSIAAGDQVCVCPTTTPDFIDVRLLKGV
jgi:hypothetical protein